MKIILWTAWLILSVLSAIGVAILRGVPGLTAMVVNDSAPDVIEKVGYERFSQVIASSKVVIQHAPLPATILAVAWGGLSLVLLMVVTKRKRSSNQPSEATR